MPKLYFKGKNLIQNYYLTVKYHELIPDEAASLTGKVSLDDNLIIHGDNMVALKALLPHYGGRVKCIYIDPPYNTGQDERDESGKRTGWVYSDNVDSPEMREWLGRVVGPEAEDLEPIEKAGKRCGE